jgi:mevalonate kinase
MDNPEEPAVQSGRGFGKLILFGEHSVVYGLPGIAAGLPRGATASARPATDRSEIRLLAPESLKPLGSALDGDDTALSRSFSAILETLGRHETLQIDVVVSVPLGAGLGSSAAIATAVARCLQKRWGATAEKVHAAISASESVFHSNPSGIDQAAAMNGGIFRFCKGQELRPLQVEPITVSICQADRPASTAEMVERVGQLHRSEPSICAILDQLMERIAAEATTALEESNWSRVGSLMDLNHGALTMLGVTTPALDRACHLAREYGALGAKLTGAGGGGCVLALTPEKADDVCRAWNSAGLTATQWTLKSTQDGNRALV